MMVGTVARRLDHATNTAPQHATTNKRLLFWRIVAGFLIFPGFVISHQQVRDGNRCAVA